MLTMNAILTLAIFTLTVLLITWRPRGMNESIPSTVGATVLFLLGVVPLADIYHILGIVSGASITILSTIVMSMVLDSVGFFRWTAYNISKRARGSGMLLYW